MDRIPQMHIWATFSASITVIAFFTLSVAFLSHGLLALVISTALMALTGACFAAYYHATGEPLETKLLAFLNLSLMLGLFPSIGVSHVLGGMIALYVWLSLITLNLAYSTGLILYHELRIEDIF